MKKTRLLMGILSLWIWTSTAYAAFVSGSTGADGAFNPTANTVVALPPNGVLNYTTVNIPAGVTITFQKNIGNPPVYMLATGDVVIAGTISVNGGSGTTNESGKGGPGGFDGGYGGGSGYAGGKGLGPGGGNPGTTYGGAGGGYGSNGDNGYNGSAIGGSSYGDARLLPLLAGSGGGGGIWRSGNKGGNGGGGGGAIVIASSTSITVTGSVTANGGNYGSGASLNDGGGGSGGAVKLVADSISGNGNITATGGLSTSFSGKGGMGRIRIEATTNNRTAATDPPNTLGSPSGIFVANPPSLSITTIAGANVPAAPTGSYSQPDILLPSSTTNPVPVNISATNIPDGTTVTVWVIPQYGNATSVDAILSNSTATANITLVTTYSNIITAQSTFTVVGMYYNGEEIDKVRVATKVGGHSETTYITRSGKEITGELLALVN